ncbi:MAG: oxamate carbamoyltransferase subunit AllH family protein [Candidatus Hodarchaeales archaeon]|jgi:hypothetical protein
MSHHLEILERNLHKNDYVHFLNRIEAPLNKFSEEIIQTGPMNILHLNTIYSELLGLGEGSTPQSDDVFLGVITVISILDPKTKQKFVNLAVMKYEDFTTKKSSILIRKFLHGNFPKEVQNLMRLLKRQDQMNKFETELRKIKVIGASSGLFFLVGLLWQLQYYEKLI